MCCFATIYFRHNKLKAVIHKKCPLRASPIFRNIPSDIISLPRIAHPWTSIEYIPEFPGISPHIVFMSEIEILKYDINSLKDTIINQLQDHMEKRGFSSTELNIKTIIDAMGSKTQQIMEEIVSNTELITSKLIEEPGTNGHNLMCIAI